MNRPAGPADPGGAPARRPRLVDVVSALVLLEALVLLVGAGASAVDLVRGTDLPGPVAFLMVLALGLAALLVAAARALRAGRRWARSPVMTWQILLVVLSIGWLGAQAPVWTATVLVVALAVAVGLLLPPVVAWTTAPRAG